MSKKAWSGRFKKPLDKRVEIFNASINFDQRLAQHDIELNIAHANMLAKQNIIPKEDADKIIDGLQELLEELKAGTLNFSVAAEDIHMNVEMLLRQKIGDAADKLHTAKSRNDQIATDLRLFTKSEVSLLINSLSDLLKVLNLLSEKHINTSMPAYTHLQRAQPTTFGYHLDAYAKMFTRDVSRLQDCLKRTDVCALGAGACAGTTLPIDPIFTAEKLGFSESFQNTLDAVSDRDFVIETISCCSIIMMHLSRLCEELIFWCSDEVQFLTLDDAFATGSSLMPNKKNPDVPELIRGKTGRVFGDLVSILTVMKALPMAYNKDMQEDKEPLFDAVDTTKQCLEVLAPFLKSVKVNQDKMMDAVNNSFVHATAKVDELVKQGVPFRQAHEIVGQEIAACLEGNDAP